VEKTSIRDTLAVVGNREWLQPDGDAVLALYDQQPIEAGLMVEASLAGYDATGDVKHLRRACRALEWFFGRNLQGLSLYDPGTGGCFDALMEGRVNQSQGAEATVCLLLARLVTVETLQHLADKALTGRVTGEASPLPSEAQSAEPSAQAASGEALARP